MNRYEFIVIGAGPAGLSGAIEAAKAGMKVLVIDENHRPGGQLFKQIHKFFGSREHKAKIRGFMIGEKLLEEATSLGVEVRLDTTVMGIYKNREIICSKADRIEHIKGDHILVAAGASENMIPFKGWTLPGVIGAGAAQTMMNLHGVRPGKKILMVGSGNVGLVVSYQLMQAGCEVVAIIDAAPRIGGYGVHASKVARTGVPFYLSHTVVQANGDDHVTSATIGKVDANWKIVEGSQKTLEVDTICIAVGLSPMSQLLRTAGCLMAEVPQKGGLIPVCVDYTQTSLPGIYAAGDVAGIEEASSAMIQGRIAGAQAARNSGYISEEEFLVRVSDLKKSLGQLREGMFGHEMKGRTDIVKTEEGFTLSKSLLEKGYIDESELASFPAAVVCENEYEVHPIIECTQNIPCNPCQDVCSKGCIIVGDKITKLPIISDTATCTGCAMCVASCPGQAIFLMKKNKDGSAIISLPYEFLPIPEKGSKGMALDRKGEAVCEAEVVLVQSAKALDHTVVLSIMVPAEYADKARFFRAGGEKL